jgi:tight adherence protein B
MSPVIVFVLLLIPCFAVLLYFLKPSPAETAVHEHLANIERGRTTNGGGTILIKKEQLSSTPWLDDRVAQIPGSAAMSRLIRQAGSTWTLRSLVLLTLLAAGVAGWLASLLSGGLVLSLCIGAAAGVSPYLYLCILREIRFRRFDALIPEAVDLMARGLRAGHAVSAVLEMVGRELAEPLASEFRTLHEEQSLGLPLRDAILNLVERVPRDDLRFLATALMLHKETGGNLVQILDKTAALLRERARLRGQLRIYTAQGRITGWILGFAPFALFGLISLVNRDYEKLLFTEPLGLYMVYTGGVMMILGVLIIRKIIDVKV